MKREGNNKRGNPNFPLPGKKFTSEYQPSSEAKRAGWKKAFEEEKIKQLQRQTFLETLLNMKFDKKEKNFFKVAAIKIQELLFSENSKLSDKEKSDLIIKILSVIESKNLKVDVSGNMNLSHSQLVDLLKKDE